MLSITKSHLSINWRLNQTCVKLKFILTYLLRFILNNTYINISIILYCISYYLIYLYLFIVVLFIYLEKGALALFSVSFEQSQSNVAYY